MTGNLEKKLDFFRGNNNFHYSKSVESSAITNQTCVTIEATTLPPDKKDYQASQLMSYSVTRAETKQNFGF